MEHRFGLQQKKEKKATVCDTEYNRMVQSWEEVGRKVLR